MKVIFAALKSGKAKVMVCGKTINLLTLLVSISKCLAERVSKEKQISLSKAEIFVLDCIADGMKTIKM